MWNIIQNEDIREELAKDDYAGTGQQQITTLYYNELKDIKKFYRVFW